MNPTTSLEAASMVNTVEYVMRRRHGYNPDRIIPNVIQQENQALSQRANQIASQLLTNQQEVERVTTSLRQEVEAFNALRADQVHVETLRNALREQKERYQELIKNLNDMENKLRIEKVRKEELSHSLNSLCHKLNSNSPQSLRARQAINYYGERWISKVSAKTGE